MTSYQLFVGSAEAVPSVTMPEMTRAGTPIGVDSLAFDAATTEGIQWQLPKIAGYTSGNFTIKGRFYASATSGNVRWVAALCKLTPGASTNIETGLTWGTEGGATQAINASTKGSTEFTISGLAASGVADGDTLWVKLYRYGDDGTNDTMAGDAYFIGGEISFS